MVKKRNDHGVEVMLINVLKIIAIVTVVTVGFGIVIL